MSIAPSPTSELEITLRPPRSVKMQLVFRQERTRPFDVAPISNASIRCCDGLPSYLRHFRAVRTVLGLREALKGCLKVLTRRRMFFCAVEDGAIIHFAWATIGRSRYYWIDPDAVVIGPIWTAPAARGRNLATAMLQTIINHGIGCGRRKFFIDTSPNNHSCRRVIEKAEFGEAIGAFVRPDAL